MVHREHPGLILALAFGAGIWARGETPLQGATLLLALGGILAAALIRARARGPSRGDARHAVRTAIFFAAGLWRGGAPEERPGLPPRSTEPVRVEGIVIQPPVEVVRDLHGSRSAQTLFTIETGSGVLQVSCPGRIDGAVGGRKVSVSGTILPPLGPRNPGDGSGSGRPLLQAPHPGNVIRVSGRIDGSLAGMIGWLRGRIHITIDALYSERGRGFILAMLLGDRRLLAPDVRDALLLTGTYHLLAISGLHVALVMALFLRIPLPARGRTAARLGLLGLFTAITGASPPVLRAALMFTIGILLERAGRRARPLNSLGWTALILLGADPSLLHDAGFQLSFVAVLSILTLSARLAPPRGPGNRRGRGRKSGKGGGARLGTSTRRWAGAARDAFLSSLAVSVGASAGTAPITLVHFQRIHPLGPLWNLFAYPLTVIPLAGGFASLALGLIDPVLGIPVARLVEITCDGILGFLALGASLPGSTVFVPRPPGPAILLSAGALAAVLLPESPRRIAAGAAILAAASAGAILWPRDVALWSLDAGSGDAALLSVPGAGSFLIDAGARGLDRVAGDNLARAVLGAGERSLQAVFLTHAHADHVRGLAGILERAPPAEVWVPASFEKRASGAAALAMVRGRGIPVRLASRGLGLRFPGAPRLGIDVLHPHAGERLPLCESANDSSLALRVSMEGSRLLFLGDIEEAGTGRLLSTPEDLRAEVLVAPHHGRENALWPELLERVAPRAVVISGSGDGGARNVAERLEAASIAVYATWRGGAIRTTWRRGRGWEPAYWRPP